jgi:hypothetical protein
MSASNLYWDNTNNRLGVGTNAPFQRLSVVGTTTTTPNNATWISAGNPIGSFYGEGDAGNMDFFIGGASTTISSRPVLIGRKSAGTLASPTALSNGHTIFSFLSSGFSGTTFINTASINMIVDGNVSTTSVPQAITFETGASSRAERMRLSSSGNLLINTTTDAGFKLDVAGTARIQNQFSATGSISAASAIARGTFLNQTLVATANNDVLVGLDIQPTFTLGAFTGVTAVGLRVRNSTNTGNALYVDAIGNTTIGASLGVPSIYGSINLILSSGSGNLLLQTNYTANTGLTMFNATRNVVIQNGGTFTDAGYRLDVNGSVRATGSISAAAGVGRGTLLNQTLVATANNDTLYGLDIVPTFTNGAFTGVANFHIRLSSNGIISGNNQINLLRGRTFLFFGGELETNISTNSSTAPLKFSLNGTANTMAQFFGTTGNFILQNGGTFTDAGFRLDVNGTARVSGAATITAQTKIGTTVYTDASSGLLIGKMSGSTAARGFLASDTNYQDFAFVATAVSAGNINSWGFGQRRDTYFGNQIGSFQIVGAYYNNSGVGSMVGGGFRVPLICNPDGTVIIAGASSNAINGNVLVGTTTDVASSKLTIESTTQGVLIPRMTTTQRDAITSAEVGLQIFNTTTSCVEYYDSFWGWMPVSPTNEWYGQYGFNYFNDGVQSDGVMGVGASGAGAGINGGANILGANGPGNATFITGTLATGICRIASHSSYAIGGGRILQEYRCGHAILSTAANRYTSVLGFQDVFGSPNQVDGVFFLYDEGGVASGSTASPNWQCVTSSNSVRTFTTTSISVGSQRKLRFTINDAGTEVLFYIDNVLVATHTTNIPTGNSRSANWGAMVTKSVGITSTQALVLDYISFKTKFTTPR